jgi:hypothetical protein
LIDSSVKYHTVVTVRTQLTEMLGIEHPVAFWSWSLPVRSYAVMAEGEMVLAGLAGT